jgi:NAD-dependent dihydropyrimidine dehydrogenase PreA subunit
VTKKNKTIYCHCAYYQFTPDSVKEKVLNALKGSGIEYEAVADLCQMCAEQGPELKRWAQHEKIRIIACYPRAIKWLFHRAGSPLAETGVEFLNMRTDSTEKIISSLTDTSADGKTRGNIRLEKTGDWVPWFPVIDYDRCENCKQCLSFCLFGVYELTEQDKVEVRNPANCKTNCPACAKACPHSAIIFPKYSEGPVNGDEVNEEILQTGEKKIDISNLSDVNVYDAIRQRSRGKKRFSKEQGADAAQRPSTLQELHGKLDIPPEVLASLSPSEMAKIRANIHKKGRAETEQNPGGEEERNRDE